MEWCAHVKKIKLLHIENLHDRAMHMTIPPDRTSSVSCHDELDVPAYPEARTSALHALVRQGALVQSEPSRLAYYPRESECPKTGYNDSLPS